MATYLVMLQTNSNQPFIFSSPRLREQIGASFEITLLSQWVKEAACDMKLPSMSTSKEGIRALPASFWVSDSSGKVIVRFTDADGTPEKLAKELIRRVTLRALTDAPGLDVTGVFIETTSDSPNPKDLDKLDRVFGEYSLNRRPAAARFPQFPYLIRGEESALPASAVLTDEDCKAMRCYAKETLNVPLFTNENTDFSPPTQTDQDAQDSLSLPSRVKRAWSRSARRLQLNDVVSRWSPKNEEDRLKIIESLCEDPFQLEKAFQDVSDDNGATGTRPEELSSVGVIHIDGNGVGAIMRDLGRAFDTVDARLDSLKDAAYQRKDNPCSIKHDRFQWFVMEVNYRLDGVVNQAVAEAWADVEKLTDNNGMTVLPVVPVLVGGDDVTVYTDGRYAIPFAEAYIRHYERLTGEDDLLKALAVIAGAPEPGSLTASAGAAIVGRNFPFHIAYDLAEGLVSRGKKLGKKPGASPCSTIDFHVLRDATVLDPQDTLDEYEGRTQRPFLVGHYAPGRIGTATTTLPLEEATKAQGEHKKSRSSLQDDTAAQTPETNESQLLPVWTQFLRAVAAFDGKYPDSPDKTLGDPFPRARANRIVKLLAEDAKTPEDDEARSKCLGYVLTEDDGTCATQEQIDEDAQQHKADEGKKTKRCEHPICAVRLEWKDALENAQGAKDLVKALGPLPSQSRLAETTEAAQAAGAATMNGADGAEKPDGSEKNAERKTPEKTEDLKKRKKLIEDYLEQVKWLLDLIDLSENLPNGYIDSFVKAEQSSPSEAGQLPDADGVGHAPAGNSSEGGDK